MNLSKTTWFGPLCGLASAVLYTLTNIALRNCVTLDAYLVSAVKAAPTVLVMGPIVGWLTLHKAAAGRPQGTLHLTAEPHTKIPQFIAASFLAQFFGNAAFQKALEHIGLAASVPITLGVLIVGGAALGALILKEPVGTRKVIAMITLIAAVIVLSLPDLGVRDPGVPDPNLTDRVNSAGSAIAEHVDNNHADLSHESTRALQVVTGSLWAALSGLAYSFFGVTMRQTLQTGVPARTLMLISGLTGTVTLGGYCLATLGTEAIGATDLSQWVMMVTAGFLNFSAFIAITTALRLLPVVAVNLINASQVAMAALAGVIFFSEPVTWQLALGLVLTFAGLTVLARRTRAPIVITD